MLEMRRQDSLCDSRRDDELDAALQRAFRRILSWRIPPNWSAHDWSDEVKAITDAASCQAQLDYDPQRGVPISAFSYQRALACVWTRYRQEWAYALRFIETNGNGGDEAGTLHGSALEAPSPNDSLRCALLELPSADQWLIRQLFWNKTTEDKLATNLKISQQAEAENHSQAAALIERCPRRDSAHRHAPLGRDTLPN